MTFRVAIENFAEMLVDENFAKEVGAQLAAGYLARINEIRSAIFSPLRASRKPL